jgi:putative oxidoreductase
MESRIMSTSLQSRENSMAVTILSWVLRIAAAVILLQTLFFKFTGAAESVYIFTKVGAEPWGRIGSGVVELIAAVLLLTPRFTWLGSVLAIGVMAGAIVSHLTILGIEVMGDKGLLFGLAITVFILSAINLFLHRVEIPYIGRKLA